MAALAPEGDGVSGGEGAAGLGGNLLGYQLRKLTTSNWEGTTTFLPVRLRGILEMAGGRSLHGKAVRQPGASANAADPASRPDFGKRSKGGPCFLRLDIHDWGLTSQPKREVLTKKGLIVWHWIGY